MPSDSACGDDSHHVTLAAALNDWGEPGQRFPAPRDIERPPKRASTGPNELNPRYTRYGPSHYLKKRVGRQPPCWVARTHLRGSLRVQAIWLYISFNLWSGSSSGNFFQTRGRTGRSTIIGVQLPPLKQWLGSCNHNVIIQTGSTILFKSGLNPGVCSERRAWKQCLGTPGQL